MRIVLYSLQGPPSGKSVETKWGGGGGGVLSLILELVL